jgi:hypothetical protein
MKRFGSHILGRARCSVTEGGGVAASIRSVSNTDRHSGSAIRACSLHSASRSGPGIKFIYSVAIVTEILQVASDLRPLVCPSGRHRSPAVSQASGSSLRHVTRGDVGGSDVRLPPVRPGRRGAGRPRSLLFRLRLRLRYRALICGEGTGYREHFVDRDLLSGWPVVARRGEASGRVEREAPSRSRSGQPSAAAVVRSVLPTRRGVGTTNQQPRPPSERTRTPREHPRTKEYPWVVKFRDQF